MFFEGGPIDLRHFIEQVTLAGERIDCFLMGHATTFPGMDHGIQRARRAMLTGFKALAAVPLRVASTRSPVDRISARWNGALQG